ncbi:MAG: caspase family protein [bacterium]|nr:caspase family protein [bacterium]
MEKKALVVGVDKYTNTNWNLSGCTKDAEIMSGILQDHFGFPRKNIRLLLDERATSEEIIHRLEWLINNSVSGDSIVFFYAGHGSRIRDRNGDELEDRLDEILCPHDLNWSNGISDDKLSSIFSRLTKGATLTVILDCCHSGTGTRNMSDSDMLIPERKSRSINPPMDILHRSRGEYLQTHRIGYTGNSTSSHVLIAACQPSESAYEYWADGMSRGAFSYAFCKAMKRRNWNLTYREAVADSIRNLRDMGYNQQTPSLEGIGKADKNNNLFN